MRDVLFLVTIELAFVAELVVGLEPNSHSHDIGHQRDAAVLVVVFFLIGIARAWELIEGPTIGLGREVTEVAREALPHDAESAGDA